MIRTIKSYVLRGGRQTTRQQEGLSTCLDLVTLPYNGTPWDFAALYEPNTPIIVEIGFGMGKSLLAMAQAAPEQQFIGIEVHRAGVGSLASDIATHQLNNIAIVMHDAVEVLSQAIPPASLHRIQIFFPDPWPKKRHYKRRIITPEFVEKLSTALRPQGTLHLATDWAPYAEWMLTILQANPALHNISPTQTFVPRPAYRPVTKFETRGHKLGHQSFDLVFEKL